MRLLVEVSLDFYISVFSPFIIKSALLQYIKVEADFWLQHFLGSIWTVDLAYLLQSFSVSFSYFTVTFGADPNYSDESFYKVKFSVFSAPLVSCTGIA